MKSKVTGSLLFGLAFLLTLTISARPDGRDQDDRDRDQLEAIGVIPIPDNPLNSTDIAWVDPGTERFYFADRSNKGVDIIDAENDTYVGRVSGFAGNVGVTNGSGPGGVLVTPDRKLWAGDGNTKVQVADVDPASPFYLKIIQTVDVSTKACGSNCNRADEIGYDPKDHKILAAIDQPRSPKDATKRIEPYAALIDANTFGVQIVDIPNITAGGGLEQPLWDGDPRVRRFFLTVPNVNDPVTGKPLGRGEIALINPSTGVIKKAYSVGDCNPSGEVLAPHHTLVVECGNVNSLIYLNARTGEIIGPATPNVPADELWFNPGDDLIYAANNDTNVLNVVDPQTHKVIQSLSDVSGRNEAAFAENNHVFTPVRAGAGDQCTNFGFPATGCVAVFAHVEREK